MQHVLHVAYSLLGTPYKFGGRTPNEGLDCSELVQLILNAGGADLPGDQTAQKLYEYFSQPANHISQEPQLGALVFYGPTKGLIGHVAWCVDRRRHIEAAGGDRLTSTHEDANRRGAFAKLTPIRFNLQFQGVFMPEYPLVQSR